MLVVYLYLPSGSVLTATEVFCSEEIKPFGNLTSSVFAQSCTVSCKGSLTFIISFRKIDGGKMIRLPLQLHEWKQWPPKFPAPMVASDFHCVERWYL